MNSPAPPPLPCPTAESVQCWSAPVRAHPEQYRWRFFADPDDHQRSRSAAVTRFTADRRAHRDGILELMRVTRDELRIFPLVVMGAVSYPHLDQLLTQLADHGITTQVTDVDYEFQASGNQMLVCTHRLG